MKGKTQIFVDGQDFICTTEACSLLGVSRYFFYNMIDNGKITWHRKNKLIYLSKKEIIILDTQIKQLKNNYYLFRDVVKLINFSSSRVRKMYYTGVFPNYTLISGNIYLLKKDVDNYVQMQNDLKEKYYKVKEASTILNISPAAIRTLVKKGRFPNTLSLSDNLNKAISKIATYYIPKTELHAYINEYTFNDNEYLTTLEASKLYGINRDVLICYARNFPNSKRLEDSRGIHIISKRDLEDFLQRKEYLKEHHFIENPNVAYHFFLQETKSISANCLYPETSELYTSFAFNQLKKSKARNKRNETRELINVYKLLLNFIHKEFYLFTDNEIHFFLGGETVYLSYSYILANFLKHCRTVKKNDCLFIEIPVRENYYNPREARETIPQTIFFQYRKQVTDVVYHIPRAIQKPRYAQIWIFITMHLFETWRAGDVVSIPNIDIDQIGVSNSDYFTLNPNGLSITQAEIILQQYYIHEFIIHKTGALNNFNVPTSFVIPLSTALVLAEIHRRNNNQNCIMYNLQVRYPNKEDYLQFFKGKKELAVFSNLKICRTLLSIHYEWLSEKSNLQGLAHEAARILRGHTATEKNLFLTDTPSIYIQDANNKDKTRNFSKHVFDRGIFGWLYYTLLLVVTDEIKLQHLSLEDKTNLIVTMQDKQSPFQIEGLGKFLLRQQEKKRTLISEIRTMPKAKLLDKLHGIFAGIMPSRISEAQCFKYGECHYPKSQEYCKRCEYLIPNKYFLISLKNEIYNLLDSYENIKKNETKALHEGRALNLESEKLKLRGILWDYMTLVQEAVNEEHGLGRETVEAYIDLKDLWEHLGNIQ